MSPSKLYPAGIKLLEEAGFELSHLYVGIDPGETTGIAVGNEDGMLGWETVKLDKIEDKLLNWKDVWEELPKQVIIEEYKLNAPDSEKREPVHSKLLTVQVIGMVKLWCKAFDIPLFEQQRGLRKMGYKYWGEKELPKSDSRNHVYDATAHLWYFMVQNRIWRVKT